ncbi:hypothetical protein [Streptosporangium sp. NPDC002524]
MPAPSAQTGPPVSRRHWIVPDLVGLLGTATGTTIAGAAVLAPVSAGNG